MKKQKELLFLLFLFGSVFGDLVYTTWTGSCTNNEGFGFTWAATDGGEAFKPDGENGAMVPCNEYFEVSFSFLDENNNVINLPALTSTSMYSIVQFLNNNGDYYITIPPEINSWGSGFVSVTGAVNAATNAAFAFTCNGNNVGNLRIRTNYLLAATNNGGTPNYARELNTVFDLGNWGTGYEEIMPTTPAAGFAIGQTMCGGVGDPITFAFPAGVIVPTSEQPGTLVTVATSNPIIPTNPANPTSQGNTPTSQGNTPTSQGNTPITPAAPIIQANAGNTATNNGLSQGGVAGIVIMFILLAIIGTVVGIILFLKFRKPFIYESYKSSTTEFFRSRFRRGRF